MISSITCRQHVVPQKVVLKDYNVAPAAGPRTEHDVPANALRYAIRIWHHYANSDQGATYAQIRAKKPLQSKRFMVKVTVAHFRAGTTFELDDHYRDNFNQNYLARASTPRHPGN